MVSKVSRPRSSSAVAPRTGLPRQPEPISSRAETFYQRWYQSIVSKPDLGRDAVSDSSFGATATPSFAHSFDGTSSRIHKMRPRRCSRLLSTKLRSGPADLNDVRKLLTMGSGGRHDHQPHYQQRPDDHPEKRAPGAEPR